MQQSCGCSGRDDVIEVVIVVVLKLNIDEAIRHDETKKAEVIQTLYDCQKRRRESLCSCLTAGLAGGSDGEGTLGNAWVDEVRGPSCGVWLCFDLPQLEDGNFPARPR